MSVAFGIVLSGSMTSICAICVVVGETSVGNLVVLWRVGERKLFSGRSVLVESTVPRSAVVRGAC